MLCYWFQCWGSHDTQFHCTFSCYVGLVPYSLLMSSMNLLLQIFLEGAWASEGWKVFQEAIEDSKNKLGGLIIMLQLWFLYFKAIHNFQDCCDTFYTFKQDISYRALRVLVTLLWISVDLYLFEWLVLLQCLNINTWIRSCQHLFAGKWNVYSLSKLVLLQLIHCVAEYLLW
jgi:hypothetical protein